MPDSATPPATPSTAQAPAAPRAERGKYRRSPYLVVSQEASLRKDVDGMNRLVDESVGIRAWSQKSAAFRLIAATRDQRGGEEFRLALQANPRVTILGNNVSGCVLGTVVYNNLLPIRIRLTKHTLNTWTNKVCVIVCRRNDADDRPKSTRCHGARH